MPQTFDLTRAFKRLNFKSDRYDTGIQFIVTYALIAIFFLFTQTQVIADLQKTKPLPRGQLSVKTVAKISVIDASEPRWCYDAVPAFVFFSGRSLFSSTLDGRTTELLQLEKPVDGRSLSCSKDGRVIFFMSGQHDFAYLYKGGQLAVYAVEATPSNIRYGSPLSPSGDELALSSEPQLVSGPDLLRTKRILNVHRLDVFWTRDDVYVGSNPGSYDILSIATFDKIGKLSVGTNLVEDIVDCGTKARIMTYLSPADEKRAVYLGADGLTVDFLSQTYDAVGSATSNGEVCVLPFLDTSHGDFETVDHLVLMTDEHTAELKIQENRFLDSRFFVAKDFHYLALRKHDLSDPRRHRGELVVLQIGDVTP